MLIKKNEPPRKFVVGKNSNITISDAASIILRDDEQVTFMSENKEFDICSKNWGFYATPSINGRLKSFGYKVCICSNSEAKIFILLVDNDKLDKFYKYIEEEALEILAWIDENLIKSIRSEVC